MYLLRDYLPAKEPEGWIKVDALKDYGFRITPIAEKALGGGRGAGRKLRFETATVTDRGRKRTKNRIEASLIYLTPLDLGEENDRGY